MALDPPWRLDPHQSIVEVGWGAAKIAALVLNIDYVGGDAFGDTPLLSGLPFGTGFNLLAQIGFPGDTPIVNPFSSAMLAHELAWSRTPWSDSHTESQTTQATVVDEAIWNGWIYGGGAPLGGVRVPYDNGVPNQDVLNAAIEGWCEAYGCTPDDIYWIIWEVTASHTVAETVNQFFYTARSIVFLNLGRSGGLITPSRLLTFEVATEGASSSTSYRWSIDVETWDRRRDFASDPQNNPTWGGMPKGYAGTTSPNVPETAMPACTSHFAIDLDTLEATAERLP
jgi:hypothetical protein